LNAHLPALGYLPDQQRGAADRRHPSTGMPSTEGRSAKRWELYVLAACSVLLHLVTLTVLLAGRGAAPPLLWAAGGGDGAAAAAASHAAFEDELLSRTSRRLLQTFNVVSCPLDGLGN
jgi:hypothetical protein